MQTRDEVEGLHNLECLYETMQTGGKSFLLLLQNNVPEKKEKLFV